MLHFCMDCEEAYATTYIVDNVEENNYYTYFISEQEIIYLLNCDHPHILKELESYRIVVESGV